MSTYGNSILRITRDIRDVQTSGDLSIAVAFKDADVRRCRCLIIGPVGTPYEFGLFEFDVKFGDQYPTQPPDSVKAITTNGGRTRFNPNIYAEGKVCLSILGTWRGEPGENWSSAQGLESLLWSIQSLMSSSPFQNEPGYENYKDTNKDVLAYAAKVHHETLRISVLNRIENCLSGQESVDEPDSTVNFGEDVSLIAPWEPFTDKCKIRFLWYYDCYFESIRTAKEKYGKVIEENAAFRTTSFEYNGNQMTGKFDYGRLTERLEKLHKKLEDETQEMVVEGSTALKRESPTALLFQNQFKAVKRDLSKNESLMDLEMVDDNPFHWRIILFGKTSTNLEGGIFKIQMVIPTDFPERMPRATVETPIFHYRVTQKGTLCYVPQSPNDISSHVQGIARAIEDESPVYDPRTHVNVEASKLLWGSEEQKKLYRRKLRRSAQDSSE